MKNQQARLQWLFQKFPMNNLTYEQYLQCQTGEIHDRYRTGLKTLPVQKTQPRCYTQPMINPAKKDANIHLLVEIPLACSCKLSLNQDVHKAERRWMQ
jgi:hypothetical protein